MAHLTRLNELTCSVAELQGQRDDLHMQYSVAMETLRQAQVRCDELEAEHQNCSWNCSVQVAKPYFVGRAQHEEVVEQQIRQMESLRRRLTEISTRRNACLMSSTT